MDQNNQYPGIRQAVWLLVLFLLLIIGLAVVVGISDEVFDLSLTQHPATWAVIQLLVAWRVLKRGLKHTNVAIGEVFPFKSFPISLLLPIFATIIGVGIILSELNNVLRALLPQPDMLDESFHRLMTGQTSLCGSILLGVVVAPFTEELLFRGLILRGFLSRYTVRKSVLVSALLFGLLHLDPWNFLQTTILGLLFAWWFLQTRSLLPCIFGHALCNAVPTVVVGIFHLEIPGFSPGSAEVKFQPFWFDLIGLLLAGWGVWLLTRMFVKPDDRNTHDETGLH